jgi:hypothetical protein
MAAAMSIMNRSIWREAGESGTPRTNRKRRRRRRVKQKRMPPQREEGG